MNLGFGTLEIVGAGMLGPETGRQALQTLMLPDFQNTKAL